MKIDWKSPSNDTPEQLSLVVWLAARGWCPQSKLYTGSPISNIWRGNRTYLKSSFWWSALWSFFHGFSGAEFSSFASFSSFSCLFSKIRVNRIKIIHKSQNLKKALFCPKVMKIEIAWKSASSLFFDIWSTSSILRGWIYFGLDVIWMKKAPKWNVGLNTANRIVCEEGTYHMNIVK